MEGNISSFQSLYIMAARAVDVSLLLFWTWDLHHPKRVWQSVMEGKESMVSGRSPGTSPPRCSSQAFSSGQFP